jgi:hypothetical protein
MTYEEMMTIVHDLLDESEAAAVKAERVLELVPTDDIIVGDLHTLVMVAGDKFRATWGQSFDETIAAASKLRNASLAWARYVEVTAAAPDQSIPGRVDALLLQLQTLGLIVDSGERRWSEKKNCDDVVWVVASGWPADYDAGSSEANAVLKFIRERSTAE